MKILARIFRVLAFISTAIIASHCIILVIHVYTVEMPESFWHIFLRILFAFFFAAQTLLTLSPVRRIHQSWVITNILMFVVGLPFIVLTSLYLYDPNPKTGSILLPLGCLWATFPIWLFLECWRYKAGTPDIH